MKELGGGEFGRIRLVRLKGVLVAVKSRKPTAQVDPDSFIALLAELKAMLFIKKEGGHANVVGFVGANTKDIRTCTSLCALNVTQFVNVPNCRQVGGGHGILLGWKPGLVFKGEQGSIQGHLRADHGRIHHWIRGSIWSEFHES